MSILRAFWSVNRDQIPNMSLSGRNRSSTEFQRQWQVNQILAGNFDKYNIEVGHS